MDKLCKCKNDRVSNFKVSSDPSTSTKEYKELLSSLQYCNCDTFQKNLGVPKEVKKDGSFVFNLSQITKPECDHIVGKIDFCEDHLYEQSWGELKEFFKERDIKWRLEDKSNIWLEWEGDIRASSFIPFDYCHLCGEKIDLQAVIESTKKLNLKKDE